MEDTSPRCFMPDGAFRVFWNYLLYASIFAFSVQVTVCYALEIPNTRWPVASNALLTAVYLFDVFVNFRTAFVRDGELITSGRDIALHYLRRWFLLDLISSVPLDLIAIQVGRPELAHSLSLLRLFRLPRAVRLFAETDLMVSYSVHVRVITYAFWSLTCVNCFACGWIAIYPAAGSVDRVTEYNRAVYWVVTTLASVGYGDITPTTNTGRLYAIVLMLAGVGMYGLVIGNISSLLARSSADKVAQEERIFMLTSFLRQYGVPKHLQESIFSYYRHHVSQHLSDEYRRIMSELPQELQQELQDYIKVSLLEQVPLFKGISHHSLKEMVRCFEARSFAPGDVIIREGEIGNEMYLILFGMVDVESAAGRHLARLRTGNFFGEIALLRETARVATIRARTHCQIYVLQKSDFLKLLERHVELNRRVEKISAERYSKASD